MFTGGPITRGINCKKNMPTQERIYLFCRGRLNANFSDGLTTKGYTNGYSGRAIVAPEITQPNVATYASISGYISFFNNPEQGKAYLIGTGRAVNTELKRYLVVEAEKTGQQQADITLYLKFSTSKELEDDGGLIAFVLGARKKHYIDLRAEGITGYKYISLINGLWADAFGAKIYRIYLTDTKENALDILYDGALTTITEWEGWSNSGTVFGQPGTIEDDYILLDGDGTHSKYVITSQKVNISGKGRIGVMFDVDSGGGQYSDYIQMYIVPDKDNSTTIGSAQVKRLAPGTNQIAYISIRDNQTQYSDYGYSPIAGEQHIAICGASSVIAKIKKVWLE